MLKIFFHPYAFTPGLGTKCEETPKNSVISINHILVQPLKKKTKVKKIRDELNIKILQRSRTIDIQTQL